MSVYLCLCLRICGYVGTFIAFRSQYIARSHMLTLSCAAGVQALWRLARATYARREPIRLGQVSHGRDIQRRVSVCIVQSTRRHAAASGLQNVSGRSILIHPRSCVFAGAILCTLCTAGTYSTGTGRRVLAIDCAWPSAQVCVHAHACISVFVSLSECVSMCWQLSMCVCVSVYLCLCLRICGYVCTSIAFTSQYIAK